MSKRTKPNYQRIWAETGDNTKPVDSYIQGGWLAVKPPRQYMNWIQNRQDSMLAYINQAGIVEWEANTDYEANFSYVQGSDNKVYKCLANNGPSFVGATSKDPVNPLNSAFWVESFATKAALTAATTNISTLQTQMTNGSGASNPAAWRTALSVPSVTEAVLDTDFTGANQDVDGPDGYQKLPGGLILQWGNGSMSQAGVSNTFPIAFPTGCLHVSGIHYGTITNMNCIIAPTPTTVSFTAKTDIAGGPYNFTWFAIGI